MTFFLRKRNKVYINLVLEAPVQSAVDRGSLSELWKYISDKAMNYFSDYTLLCL